MAVPLGRLADRVGRWPVVLGGYGCLLAVYLLLAAGWTPLPVVIALYGAFYAATDGALVAVAVPLLPVELTTTGLPLLQTAQALTYAGSSILFGLGWHWWGLSVTCWVAAKSGRSAAAVLRHAAPDATEVRSMSFRTKVVLTLILTFTLVAATVLFAGLCRRDVEAVVIEENLGLTGPGLLVRDVTTGHLAVVDPAGRRAQGTARCLKAARCRRSGGLSTQGPREARRLPAGGGGAPDFGTSFATDDNTFYVTMATGGNFRLIQGDFHRRTLTILADGVECPSLSPDGTRLVYKSATAQTSPGGWRCWTWPTSSELAWPRPRTSTTRASGSTTPPSVTARRTRTAG